MNSYNSMFEMNPDLKTITALEGERVVNMIESSHTPNFYALTDRGVLYLLDGISYQVIKRKDFNLGEITCFEKVTCEKRCLYAFGTSMGQVFTVEELWEGDCTLVREGEGKVSSVCDLGLDCILVGGASDSAFIELVSLKCGQVKVREELFGVSDIRDFSCFEATYGKHPLVLACSRHKYHFVKVSNGKMKIVKELDFGTSKTFDEVYAGEKQIISAQSMVYQDDKFKHIVEQIIGVQSKYSCLAVRNGIVGHCSVGSLSIKDLDEITINNIFLREDSPTCLIHYPYGRFIASYPDGELEVVDFRPNSLKFIQEDEF